MDYLSSGVFKTTLVVAPLSLIGQWEEELESKTNLNPKVIYGESKSIVNNSSFAGVDVVLTTYGTLQAELYASKKNNLKPRGLLSYEWFRVILDEAHFVKNPTTLCSKACCMLRAERRWCVTGTPIQNSLEDVFALLKFLRHEPWCESGFWKAAVSDVTKITDIEGKSGQRIALDRVRRILAPVILRRCKDTLNSDGEPILTLPPLEVKTVDVYLSLPEREFYNALKTKSQSIFEGLVRKGTFTKSYFQILALLNRLRQACDHVSLTVKNHTESLCSSSIMVDKKSFAKIPDPSTKEEQNSTYAMDSSFLTDLLHKFRLKQASQKEDNQKGCISEEFVRSMIGKINKAVALGHESIDDECAVCLDNIRINNAAITPCAHIFCKDCIAKILMVESSSKSKNSSNFPSKLQDGECPCCKEKIEVKRILLLFQRGDKVETKFLSENEFTKRDLSLSGDISARATLENVLKNGSSSKLSAILEELENVWSQDPGSKILVFSQFLGFLDLLQLGLRKNKIPFWRLDGKLSLSERKKVIQNFKTESNHGDSNQGSVLLISMRAGGIGLNLVQASSVFIVDPWWNVAVEEQCIMRCHRIGQTAPVVRIRKFIVKYSVEEQIIALQERKRNMADHILSDNDEAELKNANKATLEDFKLLFGLKE